MHIPSFAKRVFGAEKVGDLTLNDLKVLLYLQTVKDRHQSPERAAEYLGIGSENTVVKAFSVLRERGYVKLAKSAPAIAISTDVRDPRLFQVTAKGKRALRPFLGVVGLSGLITVAALTFAFGAILGFFYAGVAPFYPAYANIIAILFLVAGAFYVFIFYWIWATAKAERESKLLSIFKKPQ